MKKITTTLFILSALLVTLTPNNVGAENSSQALELAPPVLTLNANPGQTITANINLRDISTGKLIVSNEINNFTAAGEDGTPSIILDGSDDNDAYTIKKWITPLDKIILEPKQIKKIPITIKVPSDAAPGGYYGIIRFSGSPPELETTGVSLSASLGSLIFLRVNGTVDESMKIKSFTTSINKKDGWLFEYAPIDFNVSLENTGNIYEQPVGKITITDMFDKKVANVNMNIEAKYVLSDTSRTFKQSLDSANIGKKMLFGKYRADLTVTYGNDKTYTLTKSITFWVIPYKLIGICIVITIALFFVLRFLIIRYNRSIIERAQGTHHKKSRR